MAPPLSSHQVEPFALGLMLGHLSLEHAAGTHLMKVPRLDLEVRGLGVYAGVGVRDDTAVRSA